MIYIADYGYFDKLSLLIIAETSTFIYSHSCAATCEHFEQHWNGNWFPAKAPTASPFYRKRKGCAYTRRIFLFFCRRARLLELLHKIDFRFRVLVLIFSHFWKLLLKALDKHVFFYMILYLQVFLTYTIQLYTYQRVFRDQKLNMKFFLTEGPSPTVQHGTTFCSKHQFNRGTMFQMLWFLRQI